MNVNHYNIKSHHFWQIFFDRLTGFLGTSHQSTIQAVKIVPNSDIEITCTNHNSLLPLLINLFQASEKENLIIIPSFPISTSYITSKAIWLFVSELFDDNENCLIFKSYVNCYYEKTFPKLFTTHFIKHLNKIIELQDIVRKAGVQKVDFTPQGVQFIWPVYFLPNQIATEVTASNIPGISFSRDELKRQETMTVSYTFAWAAISGTNWSGDLKSLFEQNEVFKSVYDQKLSKVDTDKYAYCADRIRKRFGFDLPEFQKSFTLED